VGVSNRQIVDYWCRVEDECGLGVDWSEAHERCWRCAYKARLEKCHIVPASLGGPDTADNLVLLCGRCHREAPNHQDPRYMWRWLRATNVPLYETYWTIRGFEEFEVMFGRRPLEFILKAGVDGHALTADFKESLDGEFEKAVIHFGEGRLNPSTIACVIAEAEKKLADRHGLAIPDAPAGRGRKSLF
jgi:hypothetical protein